MNLLEQLLFNEEDLRSINLEGKGQGILALFAFNPATAGILNALAEQLLRADNQYLSRGEREMVAAVVSGINETEFCCDSHTAFADLNFSKEGKNLTIKKIAEATKTGEMDGVLTKRQQAILSLGANVAASYQHTVKSLIDEFLTENILNENEIHDVVLIASAFAMYNRYVRSLTMSPTLEASDYAQVAERIYEHGYVSTIPSAAASQS